ncbi:hypothetical protein AB838_16770 [Rhodobacteraceae bacterium (ex Bugula neritina AB1)]|nr:hypothetical protein AB838_16770 [Rhodobacteraceae bacterium (ex Bugula neritina AB1)]
MLMNRRVVFPLVLFFVGFGAQADEAQSVLARQIEEASVTSNQAYFDTGAGSNADSGVGWTFYPPLLYRREMQVMDCDVTARTVEINPHNATEAPSIEITFDLARTKFPEPTVPLGVEYAFVMVDGDTALFELSFLPPYEPFIWSMTSGEELQQPVRFTRFLMEPVLNEEQPRRLLALLNQYQDKYCTLSG